MSRYINNIGEEVEVSADHLETSLKIKLELQEMSPSRRCNWKKHKQLMEQEGFFDSEASENYRIMIMNYQRKVSQLGNLENMVASKYLDSINAMVGEIANEKRDNQNKLRDLNKTKRWIIDNNLHTKAIIESITESMKSMKIPNLSEYEPIANTGNGRAVLTITDWHIGALVKTRHNKFNFKVATDRVNQIIAQTVNHIVANNISDIDVVYMGDLIEGSFMRASQGFEIEFNTAVQIVKASELIIKLLNDLSFYANVTYRAFSGNHDRMNQSDKGNNLHGDSAIVLSNKIVETFIHGAKSNRIQYYEADHYSTALEINGVNIKLVHGDLEKRADKGKLHDHSSRDGVSYDVLIYGHFHHFAITEIANNRFEVAVGSIKGTDNYAEKFGLESAPSQAIITVAENGQIDIKRIGLK